MIEKLSSVYDSLATIAQLMVRAGWGEATAGNFSVNVTAILDPESVAGASSACRKLPRNFPLLKGQVLLLSLSGSRMREVAQDPADAFCLMLIHDNARDYNIVDKSGTALEALRPTSELPSHLAVQEKLIAQGGHKKVLLHAHMTEAITITQHQTFKSQDKLNKTLWAIQPEMAMFLPEGVGVVPYLAPGSQEIGDATAEKFEHHDTVIWEKHGCLSVGASPDEAFDKMEMTAKSIRILLECLKAGFVPEGLSAQAINALRNK